MVIHYDESIVNTHPRKRTTNADYIYDNIKTENKKKPIDKIILIKLSSFQ